MRYNSSEPPTDVLPKIVPLFITKWCFEKKACPHPHKKVIQWVSLPQDPSAIHSLSLHHGLLPYPGRTGLPMSGGPRSRATPSSPWRGRGEFVSMGAVTRIIGGIFSYHSPSSPSILGESREFRLIKPPSLQVDSSMELLFKTLGTVALFCRQYRTPLSSTSDGVVAHLV